MRYKNKYLRVTTKPARWGDVICRIDVSHLNKKGINQEWDKIDAKYPPADFVSCLEETNDELRCFEKDFQPPVISLE